MSTPEDWREEAIDPTDNSASMEESGDEVEQGSVEDTLSEDGVDSAVEPSDEQAKTRHAISVGQFFTGGILSRDEFTRRLPVVIYVVVLMLLYIANGFHVQQRHSRVDELNRELKKLNTVATTTAVRRMSGSRQGEIEKLIRHFNLPVAITKIPPRIIERPQESNEELGIRE